MKKQDFTEVVMQAGGIEVKKTAAAVVDAIFDTITKTMVKGEKVAMEIKEKAWKYDELCK